MADLKQICLAGTCNTVPSGGGGALKWVKDVDGSGQTSLQSVVENDVANNVASGVYSHAEGGESEANGDYSHAECNLTRANGDFSHAEGYSNRAIGTASHAEGYDTTANGNYSHAEGGETTANGKNSHAEGFQTTAVGVSQHVFGECNVLDTSISADSRGTYVEIVGNGSSDSDRSNARTLAWNGKEWLADTLEVSRDPSTSMEVATKQYVDNNAGTSYTAGANIDITNGVISAEDVVDSSTPLIKFVAGTFTFSNLASGSSVNVTVTKTVPTGYTAVGVCRLNTGQNSVLPVTFNESGVILRNVGTGSQSGNGTCRVICIRNGLFEEV